MYYNYQKIQAMKQAQGKPSEKPPPEVTGDDRALEKAPLLAASAASSASSGYANAVSAKN
eukprot:357241-Chlamydomonas_euryale.AAC.4